jgi:ABC-type antimicrobial peptide transport system permease subunit
MVVGYELYQSLGLKIGDKVKLLGRTFTLTRCHPEQGNKDDITIWISLRDAQELLNKRGLINAILAIECRCAWADLAKVRAEITALLPNTQVIERASRALARAEARLKVAEEAKAALEQEKQNRANLRRERERFGAILILLVIIVTILWLSYLAFTNVQERKPEIGILRAIGFRSHQIILLFIIKALLIGITGGLLGTLVGISIGKHLGLTLEQETLPLGVLFEPKLFLLGIGVAVVLSSIASWLPALSAAQQEPAVILRRE